MAGFLANPTVPNTGLFAQSNQSYRPNQTPQNILPPNQVSDAQRMPLYNALVGSKLGYAQADNNLLQIDEALKNPDLTDEQRKYIEAAKLQNEHARESYGNYANFIRGTANALGVDVSDYGSDKTLEQSAQSLSNYAAAAVNRLLGEATPRAQAEARYKELRERGASPAQADRIISRERAGMQENFLNRLSDGIMTYGVNQDGSLNDLGVMLAQRMNPDNPQASAALFLNAFTTPKDAAQMQAQSGLLNRRLEQQVELAELERQAKRQNLLDTIQNQRDRDKFREDNANARAELQENGRNARNNANNQTRIDIENAKREDKWKFKEIDLNVNSPAGRARQFYNAAIEFGKTPEEAMEMAMNQVFTHNNKDNSQATGVFNICETIFSLIAQGNIDAAGEMFAQLDAQEEADGLAFRTALGKKNVKYQALKDAFTEYLSIDKNSPNAKDPRAQADALNRLIAKYRAANTGGDWQEIATAQKQANAIRRRNGGDASNANSEYSDINAANERVYGLLYGNN